MSLSVISPLHHTRAKSEIHLRRVPYAVDKWGPDTWEDHMVLKSCGCPAYFFDSEYDEVLGKVSEFGFWLVTFIKEDE